jgi:N-acetyltransferase
MDFNFSDNIILEDERVRMRPLVSSDKNNLLDVALQSPSLVQFSPYKIHTEEYLEEFIQNSLKDREIEFRYPFIIFDKEKNAWAGCTSFANISNKDKRAEIGWTWIGKDFQKTGLNRHCKFLLLQYMFDYLEFERVEFRTDERNQRSRTAMEKMGAKFEGALRSHTLMNDGFRRTTVYYSILKPEWEKLKPRFLDLKI